LIKEDYHWVKEEKYKHPEYLHVSWVTLTMTKDMYL